MNELPIDPADLNWLKRLARALLRDPEEAEDLVQDTLMVALQATPPKGPARRSWLRSVARNLAGKSWRARHRRRRREETAARPEAWPDDRLLVERAEQIEEVSALLRGLPEPFRRTLLLHYLEDRTVGQIAHGDGLPPDTVRWRLRRGRELLRRELERRHGASWSALLWPWLGEALPPTQVAAASAAVPLATSWILLMKAAAALAVTCVAGLWMARDDDPLRPIATVVPTSQAPVLEAGNRESILIPLAPLMEAPGDIGDAAKEASVRTPLNLPIWSGRVLGEKGQPVPGARIFIRTTGARRVPWSQDPLRRSDGEGRFFWWNDDELPEAGDLGVVAEGYLDQLVELPLPILRRGELVVQLQRGAQLSGIVVDEQGRGIPNLPLLVYPVAAGLGDANPSRVLARAHSNRLNGTFQMARAATDEGGKVQLHGLSHGEMALLSLHPGWELQARASTGGPAWVWVARPVHGLRLVAVDTETGERLDWVRARVRCDLRFPGGREEQLGPWTVLGRDFATFQLRAEHLGEATFQDFEAVRFHGGLKVEGVESEWSAMWSKRKGVVEVSVPVERGSGE